MKSKRALAALSFGFIAAMFWLVPLATTALGPLRGYALVFAIYWFAFCLPLGWMFQSRRAGGPAARHLRTPQARWVPYAAGLQVLGVLAASWLLRPDHIPAAAFPLAALCGVINGFSEEFFWRGAYLRQARGSVRFQVLGVLLFTLWHVPLSRAAGVEYEGGAPALIGGALALGAFWALIANRTGSIGWPIAAHVITNMATFTGLIAVNFA